MVDDSTPGARRVRVPDHAVTASGLIRSVGKRWGDSGLVILGAERVTYREIEYRSAELAKALLIKAGKQR